MTPTDAAMPVQLLVLAKTPVPGRVKTRLCPPYSPQQAAIIAGAALADTLTTLSAVPAAARTLVVEGTHPAPPGWGRQPQRGGSLRERIANAYLDTAQPGLAALLVGMDTPQLTVGLVELAVRTLTGATVGSPAASSGPAVDAVLGPAVDGGWWALGLRDPSYASVLREVATSTPDTGARTRDALGGLGLRVSTLRRLRDVDTAADARAVAARCPEPSRFAAAVAGLVPGAVAA